MKFYCEICGTVIPEPQMCCDGRECGCMGKPVDPPVCSEECYDKLMNNIKKADDPNWGKPSVQTFMENKIEKEV